MNLITSLSEIARKLDIWWHKSKTLQGAQKIPAAVIDTRWHERHQRWKRNETHSTIITAQKRATHINKLTSYSGWFKKRKKGTKLSLLSFLLLLLILHLRSILSRAEIIETESGLTVRCQHRRFLIQPFTRTLRHMINSTYDRRLFWCLFSSQDYHRESDNSHSMQRKSGGGGWGGGWKGGKG